MSYLLFGHQSNIRSSLSETPQHRVRAHMNQRHMIDKLHHTTHAAAEISALLLCMPESGKCWGHGEREVGKKEDQQVAGFCSGLHRWIPESADQEGPFVKTNFVILWFCYFTNYFFMYWELCIEARQRIFASLLLQNHEYSLFCCSLSTSQSSFTVTFSWGKRDWGRSTSPPVHNYKFSFFCIFPSPLLHKSLPRRYAHCPSRPLPPV